MSDSTELANSDPEYVLGHVIQALSEDPRAAELDVQVRLGDRLVVLEGCVTTDEHRAAMETVVRDLLPDWEVDNRVDVRRWEAPREAEAI